MNTIDDVCIFVAWTVLSKFPDSKTNWNGGENLYDCNEFWFNLNAHRL